MRTRRNWAVALLCCVAGLTAAASADAALYWSKQGGGVGRIDVDGGDRVDTLVGTAPDTVGVGANDRHVYWVTRSEGRIGRAALDGSDPEASFLVVGGTPVGLAVNDDHVYWSDGASRQIRRADADTGLVDATFGITAASEPTALAVDGDHLYWINEAASIGRADLDGTGVNQTFASGAIQPVWGLAPIGGHIFFSPNGSLGRASIDGSGATNDFLLSGVAKSPMGVAGGDGSVYWIAFADSTLMRADAADGANVTQIAAGLTGAPYGLAYGPLLGRLAAGGAPAFPDTVLGESSATQTATFTNDGERPLTVSGVTLTGPGAGAFEVVEEDCTDAPLAVDASCTARLRFTPSSAGADAAALEVVADVDEGPAPATVPLSGEGLAPPAARLGPAPAFPDQTAGTVGPERTVTVTNDGDVDLVLGDVSLTGAASDFQLDPGTCLEAPLGPGASCEIALRFAPATPGAKVAELRLTGNQPGSPNTLALSGVALAPPVVDPPGEDPPREDPPGGDPPVVVPPPPPVGPPVVVPPPTVDPPARASPPVAVATATRRSPRAARVHRYVLDARGSRADEGARIAAYRWTVGGRTVGARARVLVRLKARTQPYRIALTVTDTRGRSRTTRLTLRAPVPRQVTATIPATVGFPADSSFLTPAAERSLRALRGRADGALRVRIVGYSDDLGPAGYNRWLSERRARRVAGVLLRGLRDAPARVVVRGGGAADPVADNSTPEGRAANRRVEIEIVTRR